MISSSSLIPKYCLGFTAIHQDHDLRKEITAYFLSQQTLSPSNATLHPFISEFLESVSSDYVRLLDKGFSQAITATFSFSLKQGVTVEACTDEKIKEVVANMFKGELCACSAKDALDYHSLEPREVDEETKKQAQENLKEENLLFFDFAPMVLWKAGVKDPVRVNLEICLSLALSQGGGLTTGILRFPHLLQDLSIHFEEHSPEKICIVGPGLFQEEKLITCPQFVEIFSLFPETQFLLLDNDIKALELMKHQFHVQESAMYDPIMLILRSCYTQDNTLYAPSAYQPLFRRMIKILTEKSISPKNPKQMLEGIKKPHLLHLKVDPKKIQLREMDINAAIFPKEEKQTFDVVIATMSLSLAIRNQFKINPSHNAFFTLGNFLALLKEKGSLYVDSTILTDGLEKMGGEKGIDLGIKYLEMLLGNRLSLRHIPLADFIPGMQGERGTISNLTLFQAQQVAETSTQNVSTSSLLVITRTDKKVNVSLEEKKQLVMQMAQLLKEMGK